MASSIHPFMTNFTNSTSNTKFTNSINMTKFTVDTDSDNDGDYTPAGVVPRKPRNFTVKLAPQAVIEWYKISLDKKIARRNSTIKEDALGHLLAMGWKIYHIQKKTKQELRYKSPKGRVYMSLRTACKAFIDQSTAAVAAVSPPPPVAVLNRSDPPVGECKEVSWSLKKRKECDKSPMRNCGIPSNQIIKEVSPSLKKAKEYDKSPMRNCGNEIPVASIYIDLIAAAAVPMKSAVGEGEESVLKKPEQCGKSLWVKKKPAAARGKRNVRTVLYHLVEQGIVSPGSKAYYKIEKSSKDDPLTAWGTITKEGLINCDCCNLPYSISKFEVHIGSTKHRPAANIFLEDGRSLSDCQKELFISTIHNQNGFQKVKKCPISDDKNDSICSICNFGGELILCDLCPAAFHSSCLGFNGIPIGYWFCPSCSCRICGHFHYNSDGVSSNHHHHQLDSSFVKCVQCKQRVHIGCVTHNSNQSIDKDNWFCSKSCNHIHMGVQNLLWKQIPSQQNQNLTWTLMKHSNSMPKNQKKKLNIALDVIQQSFHSVKDPVTECDIVRGVVLGTRSDVKRLNFEGFYIMALEMNSIVTTVATVRVHGKGVAEVPFVATRLEYRRLGLCRTLMNELELQLRKLGVKRLTLPATDEALNTWTSGFGFSRMSDSEKLELVKYTFLGFQDTVRCHKNLEMKRINDPNDLELEPRKKLKQTDNIGDDFFSYMCLDSWN